MNAISKAEFVARLQELNPEEKDNIKQGRGVDTIIYTGSSALDCLIAPAPFKAIAEDGYCGFSNLPYLLEVGKKPLYCFFKVVEK